MSDKIKTENFSKSCNGCLNLVCNIKDKFLTAFSESNVDLIDNSTTLRLRIFKELAKYCEYHISENEVKLWKDSDS